jgi:hypothetical protein
MKKFLKWTVVVIIGLIVISFIGSIIANPATKDAFNKGQEAAKKTLDTPKPTKHAVIVGIVNKAGEALVDNVNVWENAGSSGVDNVTVGTVPPDTKVEVIESKEAEGVTFYHIRSITGMVSVLPTDINLRKKAMETKPQSEWTVSADASFPLEGWVSGDFVKNVE